MSKKKKQTIIGKFTTNANGTKSFGQFGKPEDCVGKCYLDRDGKLFRVYQSQEEIGEMIDGILARARKSGIKVAVAVHA